MKELELVISILLLLAAIYGGSIHAQINAYLLAFFEKLSTLARIYMTDDLITGIEISAQKTIRFLFLKKNNSVSIKKSILYYTLASAIVATASINAILDQDKFLNRIYTEIETETKIPVKYNVNNVRDKYIHDTVIARGHSDAVAQYVVLQEKIATRNLGILLINDPSVQKSLFVEESVINIMKVTLATIVYWPIGVINVVISILITRALLFASIKINLDGYWFRAITIPLALIIDILAVCIVFVFTIAFAHTLFNTNFWKQSISQDIHIIANDFLNGLGSFSNIIDKDVAVQWHALYTSFVVSLDYEIPGAKDALLAQQDDSSHEDIPGKVIRSLNKPFAVEQTNRWLTVREVVSSVWRDTNLLLQGKWRQVSSGDALRNWMIGISAVPFAIHALAVVLGVNILIFDLINQFVLRPAIRGMQSGPGGAIVWLIMAVAAFWQVIKAIADLRDQL